MGSIVDLAGSVLGEQVTKQTSRVTGPVGSTDNAALDRMGSLAHRAVAAHHALEQQRAISRQR